MQHYAVWDIWDISLVSTDAIHHSLRYVAFIWEYESLSPNLSISTALPVKSNPRHTPYIPFDQTFLIDHITPIESPNSKKKIKKIKEHFREVGVALQACLWSWN